MVREIVTPQSQEYILNIPEEYIDKEIEILILPFSYPKESDEKEIKKDIFAKTSGILTSQNLDPLKWQDEIRDEWDR